MPPIQLTGQNLDITDILHDFVSKKFAKLERHADSITSIHVVLHVENQHKSRDVEDKDEPQQIASAKLHIRGTEIYAKTESGDMYKSIDLLVDKLVRQLNKYKRKNGERA
jgi:putative sigma-54 modulation protein